MPRFRFTHPRYQAGAVLGLGAQAVVLRVTDRDAPDRALVAKVFRRGAFDPEHLRGEFALLSRLHVPGLARAYDLDVDRDADAPFLIEDFVDGPDATTWVARAADARQRIARAAALLAGVASTLASLHDAGFVHGDLKPVHVRIASDSLPRLIDLGAAVLCGKGSRGAPGAVAFTRGYASPELLSGARPGPRSDLYALGAVIFAVLGQELPRPDRGALSLRSLVPAAPPSLADLVDRLVAVHPEDRPPDARAVLRALGESFPSGASHPRATRFEGAPSPLRAPVLAELGVPRSGVRYLAGAAGSGKSHVLGELHVRALLSGRPARLLRFPAALPTTVSGLIRFLRTGSGAPFSMVGRGLLLMLDDVHAAPAEIPAALEAFRCRPRDAVGADWDIIAGVRRVPECAEAWTLEPLDLTGTEQLLSELGEPAERAREVHEVSGGNAGFVVAMLGRVPLTRDAALSRVRGLSAPARFLLGAIAVLKGHVAGSVAEALLGEDVDAVTAELHASALVSRTVTRDTDTTHSLSHPDLADDLAEALADFDVADRLADAVLSEGSRSGGADARTLLSVAGAPKPPERREELLAEAATRAAAEGFRGDQVEALLALAANPKNRRKDVLLALDRATRGGGSSGLHPELVSWLAEGARTEPSLRVLSLRRQAEQTARAGDVPAARRLAQDALALADERGDPADRALALSTVGSMALHCAHWSGADDALARASECLRDGRVDDDEELARIDHNRGVVALYRMRLPEAREAFERSLLAKRAMGDRGGMWACLLNLGLTLAKLRDYDGAERALVEATLLCKGLGQRAGVSWCQVAFADVAVRRGDRHEAERRIAEAEHFGDALPEPVRADLLLLRAETLLLVGSGDAALEQVKKIAPGLRTDDVMLGARALVVEARANLCRLPVNARRAARLCLEAIRLARGAGLPEPEVEAADTLRRARTLGRKPMALANRTPVEYPPPVTDGGLWSYLGAVARGATRADAAGLLARAVAAQSGAERVLVAALDDAFAVTWAAGTDLDGLPLADPASRVDVRAVAAAGAGDGIVYERDVETRGGRGSRLAAVERIATERGYAAVVVEHRFAIGAFDSVPRERAEQWAVLAALALFRARAPGHDAAVRGVSDAVGGFAEESPSIAPGEPSTAVPRSRTRTFPGIVGTSEALGRALDRLDAAVESELPVLLTGETGSGKELFARALHEHGARSTGPFVAVNCGAIHDSLFEAELFGHAKGGFTGAERHRTGLIATAEGGILFLDEIGEVPLARQAVLLRVLSTRRYRPVGADDERPFDVRIIAATNRDLEEEVKHGRFRRDLLYRLNVLEVEVPPLRSRPEDIALLAKRFLAATGSRATLSASAEHALEAYAWPGNVRELEHQMQRLAALRLARVGLEHLGREIRVVGKSLSARKARKAVQQKLGAPGSLASERRQVQSALEAARGNITHAANALSLTRHGLKKKMVRLGLREPGAFARGSSK